MKEVRNSEINKSKGKLVKQVKVIREIGEANTSNERKGKKNE